MVHPMVQTPDTCIKFYANIKTMGKSKYHSASVLQRQTHFQSLDVY